MQNGVKLKKKYLKYKKKLNFAYFNSQHMWQPLRNLSLTTYKRIEEKPNAPKTSLPKSEQKLLVSETCKKRLREICEDGSFLRVTVEGGGCSGFQYKFDLDNKLNADDLQFGDDKARVVIDDVSLEYCAGSTVDFHTELIKSGFRIASNPQAEQGCSCGASFALRLD